MSQKAAPANTAPSPTASFEDAMKRLGEIVDKLEGGDLTLEESLRLFEEGMKLSRASQERLDRAQQKVEELLGLDKDGRPRTAPFEAAKGDQDEDR